MKITTGRMLMTAAVAARAKASVVFEKEVLEAVKRFQNGDWGDLSQEDKEANEEALKSKDDDLFAMYQTSGGKIYIITDDGRKRTTVLFADEY